MLEEHKNKALRTYKRVREAYPILHYISIHEEVTATSDTAQLFTLYYKEGTLTSIDRNASLLCTKTCSEPEQVKGPHFATFARTYPALRESNLDYVRSTVNEAVRIGLKAATECPAVTAKATLTPSKLPVWVCTWQRYHDAVPPFVNCSADMEMFWKQSYAAGADGLILWGYEPHTQPQFQQFWTETFAPEVLAWQ